MSTLVITQVKSANGTNGRQRDTLRSIGLRGIGKTLDGGWFEAATQPDIANGVVASAAIGDEALYFLVIQASDLAETEAEGVGRLDVFFHALMA